MSDYQTELDRLVGELNRGATARPTSAPTQQRNPTAITPLLEKAVKDSASDILLVAGSPACLRIHGRLKTTQGTTPLSDDDIRAMVLPLMNPTDYTTLQKERSVDLAFSSPTGHRFRLNVHYQRGTLAASIRLLPKDVPTLAQLNLPETVASFVNLRQGLVLLTGPTGSGKTSTLAAIVDAINRTRECHVVTIEEPVEYEHRNRLSVIEQIEVGRDTPSFLNSLRSILRQSPDVILVGEMRDSETISTALTASETGHLVLSTLHTNDTSQAISRILDSFPSANQSQIRQQFSLALAAIVAQQLVPSADGNRRYPACEILTGVDAIRNLIRHGQDHQIRSQLIMSRAAGMCTMEQSLADLYHNARITRDTALSHSFRPDDLRDIL
ncbi:MAG: PilT/PilU family type 4a pilus ATPase [Bryobacteraceae bacterium]|nr:PilT/PilU family type 4a pilus ATPase [Bryobacteraceae bacterium]